ncbi:unnamed protein product [Dicrocoelium dendriticum]|nr:unnamed protein product [Dicrocoelium dendriticum]
MWISVILTWHLIAYCRSHLLLVQNPPAVPTLFLVWLYVRLTGKHLVIDWHNYGHTLLELNSHRPTILSRLYRLLELDFAAKFLASSKKVHHLCVSTAMQQDLVEHGINATVFYDRAPETFTPTTAANAHDLFIRLGTVYPCLQDPDGSVRRTRFTEITALPAAFGGSQPQWRRDRPVLVVSSCSWTPDDDFTMAIDAMDAYNKEAERRKRTQSNLPCIVFAVTGRGPLKAHYTQLIAEKSWANVEVIMPWLEWSDYPVFLGCADLGISLHRSSSGLDLPMKVVDLIGVEVPVLALTYPTLYELVPDNQIGAHFRNASELTNLLVTLLTRPIVNTASGRAMVGSAQLQRFRDRLRDYHKHNPRMYAYWRSVAMPIFKQTLS